MAIAEEATLQAEKDLPDRAGKPFRVIGNLRGAFAADL
jgi:hypothetical protein